MTITLDIRPEVHAELARQAAARGRAVEAVAAALLEQAIHLPDASAEASERDQRTGQALIDAFAEVRGLLTDEEIDRMFARNRQPSRAIDL